MHTNPAFRATDRATNLAFARKRGFGMLSVNGPEGPLISHVPFVLNADGTQADMHLTRSNPIARAGLPAAAVIAVMGPDAYISPDWYEVPDQVPTWNYVAVHLRGRLVPLDADVMKDHVDELSAVHEGRLLPKAPWHSDKMAKDVLPRMMRMILPFRLEIAAIDGTWKLSQNKDADVQARTAQALAGQDDAGAQAVAALMRAGLDNA
jgi:transcriptional regulator